MPKITQNTSLEDVGKLILRNRCTHPSFAMMLHHLGEGYAKMAPSVCDPYFEMANAIAYGEAKRDDIIWFAKYKSEGNSDEDIAFRKMLAFLIETDELGRDAYLALSKKQRMQFLQATFTTAQNGAYNPNAFKTTTLD